MKVALIGDLHGNQKRHIEAMRNHEFTIQLGDCGFEYGYMAEFEVLRHSILGGNHDNYPELVKCPNYMGDFGEVFGAFYVRGAWSIDKRWRIEGKDWWPEEELTIEQGNAAMEMYRIMCPDVVISHEGPSLATAHLKSLFPGPRHVTRTGQLLDAMFTWHRPKRWYFAHWHQSLMFMCEGARTEFRVLDVDEIKEVELP